MSRVANLRMRGKLAAVLFLPLCALALFAGHTLELEVERQAGAAQLAQTGELTQLIGNLVHELQAERGRAGVYLARRGKLFAAEQVQQRAATDAAWLALERANGRGSGRAGAGQAGVNYGELHGELRQLRARIDQLALPAANAVDSYSLMIRAFIGLLEDLSNLTTDPELARQFTGYRALIQAKEAAGQERALGGRWLSGSGEAGEAAAGALIESAAVQDLLLDQFQAQAPEPLRRAWRDANQAVCVSGMPALRASLRADRTRPTPELWFDAASCRMERLHDLETGFARHLADLTADLHQRGRLRLALILLLALLPIVPSLWLIVRVERNVSGNARWLLTAMHGIAGGNFNISLPPRSRDELGELAAGLDALRHQLARHVGEQGRLLERERQLANELEQRSQAVQLFAHRIAAGDLTGRLGEGDDTLGRLAASLNQMAEGLAGLAGRVRESGSALVVTVSQMQGAVGAQFAGASEQAASVSETMSTLEQIRATSGQTLDKARLLGEMADRARSEGEHGRQVVEASISGIGEVSAKVDTIARTILSLNEQTQRIGEITGAVGAIARQLRLLSLNAAIEATKAGEAGLGFAVVAAEVKQLAEQSQQSTEQVQHILEQIRHATDRAVMATEDGAKGVAHGLELVQRAGAAIRGLEQMVRDTSLASRQIVAAVRQEGAGIEQITTAVGDIHKVTSQFVAATEQTRAATGELSHLAQRLAQAADSYRI